MNPVLKFTEKSPWKVNKKTLSPVSMKPAKSSPSYNPLATKKKRGGAPKYTNMKVNYNPLKSDRRSPLEGRRMSRARMFM